MRIKYFYLRECYCFLLLLLYISIFSLSRYDSNGFYYSFLLRNFSVLEINEISNYQIKFNGESTKT
jgi:hypothetical protein